MLMIHMCVMEEVVNIGLEVNGLDLHLEWNGLWIGVVAQIEFALYQFERICDVVQTWI